MSITIRLTPTSHHVEFEVGSPEEGIGFVSEKGDALMRLLDVLDRLPKGESSEPEVPAEAGAPVKERKPRGPNKPKVDAVAPAPLAVPGAAPSPPVPRSTAPTAPTPAGDSLAIPPMLQRDANNASPAVPAAPPPPAPPAPPVPAVPPTGVLAEKIIANLDKRKAGTPDNGQSLSDWLAGCGITIKGATYDEAIAVLRLQTDAKLQPLLGPLEIVT
jgi:hypothetical protein